MWPKALAQLLDLLPHIARLLPAADRFLQSRAVSDDATRQALQQTEETLRADLSDLRTEVRRVTGPHEGLYRQINEQSAQLAQLAQLAQAARAAAEEADERAGGLERRLAINNALLAILLPLVIVLIILIVLLLVRH